MKEKCDDGLDPRSPEVQFRRLHRMHRMASDTIFTHLDIREYGQPLILFILDEQSQDGAVSTQKQLAQALNVSPATVTISLKSLERLGCVQKHQNPEDMRRNTISITEKGREVAAQFRRAFGLMDAAMYSDFTEQERMILSGFFERMTNNLRKIAKGELDPLCLS